MKKVTVIVGLPASGKTTYANKLSKENGSVLFDDPVSIPSTIKKILEAPQNSFVVCHPALCEASELDLLVQDLRFLGATVEVCYFENNKQQCLLNDQKRGSLSQIDISYFSSVYNPPKSAILIPVVITLNEGVDDESGSL